MRKIVALFALMLAGLAIANATPSGVSVEVTMDQNQFLPGEELTVAVHITNLSGRDIELGDDNKWLTFYIQGDNAYIVPQTGPVPVSGKFTLHSAQVGTRRVNIAPYFSIDRPGRYRLTAAVKLPQWGDEVSSKPTTFMILSGVHLLNAPALEFGVPPKNGDSNSPPEIRKYILEKATYAHELKLYLRITDSTGYKTLKIFPIDRMVSFSTPEAQIDGYSNLHVLHQTGARSFNYSIIDPDGHVVLRQTYQYTATRPTLRKNDEGKIFVGGGIRMITSHDFPPVTASLPAPKTDAQTATP